MSLPAISSTTNSIAPSSIKTFEPGFTSLYNSLYVTDTLSLSPTISSFTKLILKQQVSSLLISIRFSISLVKVFVLCLIIFKYFLLHISILISKFPFYCLYIKI